MPSEEREGPIFELIHEPTGIRVAQSVAQARGWVGRGWGLIGKKELPEGSGLWLSHTSAIHTLGLRFPIDVLFLDGEGRTAGVAQRVGPNRLYCGRRGAHSVVELAAGALAKVSLIGRDDRWLLSPSARD